MDEATERAALQRIRVLRTYGYRCQWKARMKDRLCSAPAKFIGHRPADEKVVALCLTHSTEPRL